MNLGEEYLLLVENIKNKIKNSNFNFSKSEIAVVKLEEDLLSFIADILTNNYNSWKTVTKEFHDHIINDCLEPYLSEQFVVNYFKYLIDHGLISDSFDSSGYLSDDSIKELEQYFKEKLLDHNYQLRVYNLSSALLRIIVDAGRFDMFENIKSISDISDETFLKIKDYYNNSNNKIPFVLIKYFTLDDLHTKQIGLQNYLEFWSYQDSFDADYLDILIEKINAENYIANLKIDWYFIYKNLNNEQRELLSRTLINKQYFNPYILNNIIINDDNYENVVKNMVLAIQNGLTLNRHLVIDSNKVYKNNPILQDSRTMNALIDNGYLSLAVQIPSFIDYQQRVIQLVQTNPEKFKNIDFTNSLELNNYQDLLLELLKIGNESAYWLSNGMDKASIYTRSAALEGKVRDIPYYLMNDNEFVNQMICNEHFGIIFSSVNRIKISEEVKLSDKACEKIIELAKNDLSFAVTFVSNYPKVVIHSNNLLKFFLQINDRFTKILLDKIAHLEDKQFRCSEEVFDIVKDYLAIEYKLNKDHLEKFEKQFGPTTVKYVINENVQKFINLPNEQFNKLIALFPNVDINMVDVEKIYDSLKQYEFANLYPDIVGIFANINHSINDNDYKYLSYLNELMTVIDDKFYKKIFSIYPALEKIVKDDPYAFLLVCIKNIKSGNITEKEKYIDILHTITNYYIATKREKYRETYDIYNDLVLPYRLDENDIENKYIKYYLLYSCKDIIIDNLNNKGFDSALVADCIDYLRLAKTNFSDERLIEIKKIIKFVISEGKRLAKVIGISNNLISIMDSENLIKRKYYAETNKDNVFAVIANLRIDVLSNTLLNDEKAYLSLMQNMQKYKLHAFPDYFKKIMKTKNINIALEPVEISGFISYYQQIYEMEKKRLSNLGKDESCINLSIVPIIKYAEAYSSVSSVYNQLLGSEDARFVKANPNPHSAVKYINGNERLNKAVIYTVNNFKRQDITIPAFNEIIEFKTANNDIKRIRAVVGNFTHPSNVTHGERTGACMRIGGIGESLFDFCLTDPNGYHIRFEDCETGEYISRVSGFRNGNSVFLNELRYSCNHDLYSDSDIVDACRKTAELIINKSNNSIFPIENVFLHDAYATTGLDLTKHSLNITSNKEGLRKFYSDIGDKVIVMASNNIPFVKVDFDKSKVPVYKVARELAFESVDNLKLRNMINRVHAMKLVLNGFNYEYIDSVSFENGLSYGIVSQDWYIYIDKEGNVFEEILDVDKRAITELEEARNRIMNITLNHSIKIS